MYGCRNQLHSYGKISEADMASTSQHAQPSPAPAQAHSDDIMCSTVVFKAVWSSTALTFLCVGDVYR